MIKEHATPNGLRFETAKGFAEVEVLGTFVNCATGGEMDLDLITKLYERISRLTEGRTNLKMFVRAEHHLYAEGVREASIDWVKRMRPRIGEVHVVIGKAIVRLAAQLVGIGTGIKIVSHSDLQSFLTRLESERTIARSPGAS